VILLLAGCSEPYLPGGSEFLGGLDGGRDTGAVHGDTGFTRDTSPAWTEPPLPRLLLNEVVARNDSTADDGSASFPDWLEIFNPGPDALALNRIAVRDGSGRTWRGGDGELAAGAYFVLWAGGTEDATHAPFSLDGGGGEQLTLLVDGFPADRLATGQLGRDVALARFPDGGAWKPTIRTTPAAANGTDPGTDMDLASLVFHYDRVHDIHLELDGSAEASLRSNRLAWTQGDVRFAEGTFRDVRVRSKAYVGSARGYDQKTGWKIDLNYEQDRRWHGLETLTLNNMVQDYTYVHEAMVYDLYRAAGVPAPRTAYARVYVNRNLFGLYLLVETIDDRFLDRWYADPTGPLFEGAYGVDLFSGYENSFEYDEGDDPSDRSDLTEAIWALDQGSSDAAIEYLGTIIDMEEFLANMAVEALAWHWDGYTTRNNYRLYRDPTTDLFQIIPWGTDQTFVNYYYDPWSTYGRILQVCMANSGCMERYNEKLLEVADIEDTLGLDTLGQELSDWLQDDIRSDPRREFDVSYQAYYLSLTISQVQSFPDQLRAMVAAR
jgi:hypothetical protein